MARTVLRAAFLLTPLGVAALAGTLAAVGAPPPSASGAPRPPGRGEPRRDPPRAALHGLADAARLPAPARHAAQLEALKAIPGPDFEAVDTGAELVRVR